MRTRVTHLLASTSSFALSAPQALAPSPRSSSQPKDDQPHRDALTSSGLSRMANPTDCFDWHDFKVGDLVTRDGTDVHRVTWVADHGQTIQVVCVKAPSSGWCEVGDKEDNLARRYEFASPILDGEATQEAGALPTPENGE